MKKIKVADATGPVLDWLVAKAAGIETYKSLTPIYWEDDRTQVPFEPSTDWAQGGPIIDREKLDLYHSTDKSNWASAIWSDIPGGGQLHHKQRGPTALIAAMRCFVASKLGDEVDVPEGLVL